MSKSNAKDMTSGKPMHLIVQFFVPLLLGMLFQQFYSMMDTIIVGRCLGVKALASVGATGSVNFMIIGFCMGVCNGFAIPVAQRFGAKDYHSLRKYVTNSAWLAGIFSIVMTVVTCILSRQIMTWMRTPSDIFEDANTYIWIIFLGIPATYLYNLVSGIIRSLGDSKTPLYFLIMSSVLNIALDFIMILVFKTGVAGAAIATVVSQAISGIGCLFFMKKKFTILHADKEEWKFNWKYAGVLCGMGVPMGLQYSITAIGSVILQSAVNTLGSTAVASITAGSKISMFFCCPFDALGSTMSTYAGQNVGAVKIDRVKQGLLACSFLGLIYSVIACLILCLFGSKIALLFVSGKEVKILGEVQQFLTLNSLLYFPLALVNIVRFTIQGMGYSLLAVLAGVCEMIARSVVGFALVPVFGYFAACFANPAAWIAADLFLIPAFIYCLKHLEKSLKRVTLENAV